MIDVKLDRLEGLTVKIPFHEITKTTIKQMEIKIYKCLIEVHHGSTIKAATHSGYSVNAFSKRMRENGI
jgi:hypothetical protein